MNEVPKCIVCEKYMGHHFGIESTHFSGPEVDQKMALLSFILIFQLNKNSEGHGHALCHNFLIDLTSLTPLN